jgi:DNA-binding response OmpR family regulator
VLLVEDEALIAMELEMALENAGAVVVGPVYSLPTALEAARATELAAAVLDVDLGGRDVFPVADLLLARGVPFVFHTGHGRRLVLGRDYPDAPVCKKPTSGERVVRVLAATL